MALSSSTFWRVSQKPRNEIVQKRNWTSLAIFSNLVEANHVKKTSSLRIGIKSMLLFWKLKYVQSQSVNCWFDHLSFQWKVCFTLAFRNKNNVKLKWKVGNWKYYKAPLSDNHEKWKYLSLFSPIVLTRDTTYKREKRFFLIYVYYVWN
jgi:hypothetical protein